jgi:AraC-like DNA-binding protein
MRILRDETANTIACSTVAARFESMKSGAITNFHHRPHVPALARARSVQAGSGLAAWQQLVVMAYIERHIAESITVRALARFVYLSSSRFCRAFKQSFGIPPHRYVVQQRIERAKALLASSAWSITENRSCTRLQPNAFVFGSVPECDRSNATRLSPDFAMTPQACGKGSLGCKTRP